MSTKQRQRIESQCSRVKRDKVTEDRQIRDAPLREVNGGAPTATKECGVGVWGKSERGETEQRARFKRDTSDGRWIKSRVCRGIEGGINCVQETKACEPRRNEVWFKEGGVGNRYR